jgi:hypothetical protein
MITGATIPAKEFEGKLWILADHYQPALQAAYMGGVLAEREACAKLCEEMASWHGDLVTAAYDSAADAIRKRGQG